MRVYPAGGVTVWVVPLSVRLTNAKRRLPVVVAAAHVRLIVVPVLARLSAPL
jgi:hypothetical protein